MSKIKYLILITILLNGCMIGTVSDPNPTFSANYRGIISTDKTSAEVDSSVNISISNIYYSKNILLGIPQINTYGLDINCNGKIEAISRIPFFSYAFKEKGSYQICVEISYYFENDKKNIQTAIINTADFDKIHIYSKISYFEIINEIIELEAGTLIDNKKLTVLAYDNNMELIPYANIKVELVEGGELFLLNEDNIFNKVTDTIHLNKEAKVDLYLKAKEKILENNIINSVNTLKISSISSNPVVFNYEFFVKPGPVSKIIPLSLGGSLRFQTRHDNYENFGNIIIRFEDKFNNPVYNTNALVKITNSDNTPITKQWRLGTDSLENELELNLVSSVVNDINQIGTINFVVNKNDDITVSEADITIISDNNVIYTYNIGIDMGELFPAILSLNANTSNDFGNVMYESSSSRVFTIINNGEKDALINYTTLNNSSFVYTGFAFPGINGTCSSTLESAIPCTIELEFIPNQDQIDELVYGTFFISYYNGNEDNSISLEILGKAINLIGTSTDDDFCVTRENDEPLCVKLSYVPGGIGYPTSNIVENEYWIADSTVTYDLYYTVRLWAETYAGYNFNHSLICPASAGSVEYTGVPTLENRKQPVTKINPRHAAVFSNALTEWFNEKLNTDLSLFYYSDANFENPIKTVSLTDYLEIFILGSNDNPYVKTDANGFRLASYKELYLAARFAGIEKTNIEPLHSNIIETQANGTSLYWRPSNYAPGAFDSICTEPTSPTCTATEETKEVAWFEENSNNTTQLVKTKRANELGLYDMNGNVRVWSSQVTHYSYFPDPFKYITHYDNITGWDYRSPATGMRSDLNVYRIINDNINYLCDDSIGFRLVKGH